MLACNVMFIIANIREQGTMSNAHAVFVNIAVLLCHERSDVIMIPSSFVSSMISSRVSSIKIRVEN